MGEENRRSSRVKRDDIYIQNRGERASLHTHPLQRFMRYFKWGFLASAVLLAVITFSWGILTQDDFIDQVNLQKEVASAMQRNELLKPRFDSVDEKGQPYTIIADEAHRPEEGVVTLINPSGDIQLQNGRWLNAKALEGTYMQEAKTLLLEKDVALYESEGYVLNTQSLHVDLDKREISTQDDVSAHGPLGRIRSVGLNADLNVGLLRFFGPAHLTLFVDETQNGLGDLQ